MNSFQNFWTELAASIIMAPQVCFFKTTISVDTRCRAISGSLNAIHDKLNEQEHSFPSISAHIAHID